jgi:hypothetical protein
LTSHILNGVVAALRGRPMAVHIGPYVVLWLELRYSESN